MIEDLVEGSSPSPLLPLRSSLSEPHPPPQHINTHTHKCTYTQIHTAGANLDLQDDEGDTALHHALKIQVCVLCVVWCEFLL